MVVDPAQAETEPVDAPEAVEETPADSGWQSLEPWLPPPTEPTAAPAPDGAPEAAPDSGDEDDARPITRRNAREIAAEAVKAAEDERVKRAEAEARANRLEAEQAARQQETQQRYREAQAWVGTDAELAEFDQKIDALDRKAFGPGSVDDYGTLSDEAKQARTERVQLAQQKAEKVRARQFADVIHAQLVWAYHQELLDHAESFGLGRDEFRRLTVDTPDSKATLRTPTETVNFLASRLADQKVAEITAKHQAEIEELKATNEALKADRGSLRARAAGAGAPELETGGHGNGADLTLEAYNRMSSAERLKLKREDPGKIDRMMARAMVGQ